MIRDGIFLHIWAFPSAMAKLLQAWEASRTWRCSFPIQSSLAQAFSGSFDFFAAMSATFSQKAKTKPFSSPLLAHGRWTCICRLATTRTGTTQVRSTCCGTTRPKSTGHWNAVDVQDPTTPWMLSVLDTRATRTAESGAIVSRTAGGSCTNSGD